MGRGLGASSLRSVFVLAPSLDDPESNDQVQTLMRSYVRASRPRCLGLLDSSACSGKQVDEEYGDPRLNLHRYWHSPDASTSPNGGGPRPIFPIVITCSRDHIGYGYFYVRLYCTGLCFQANTVEEGVTLSALFHIFVGLKRT